MNLREEDKIQILFKLLDSTEKESDRFWTRSNVFVTINSALFALFAASYSKLLFEYKLIFSVLGIILTLAWLQVLRTGKYYAKRWRLDAKEFILADDDLKDIFRTACGNPRVNKPSGPSSSVSMKIISIFSLIVWLFILGNTIKKPFIPISPAKCIIQVDKNGLVEITNTDFIKSSKIDVDKKNNKIIISLENEK